ALVSAMIAASSSAFAMEALDEEAMAAATGQDGLRITLDTNLSGMNIKWIDRDGTTGVAGLGAYVDAGAVTIGPVGISTTGMTIDIDAGGSAGDTTGNGLLSIGINAPNAIVINLNNTAIGVGDANTTVDYTTDPYATRSASGAATTIIQFGATASATIGANMSMNIELGNEVNAFASITANLGTVALTDLSIVDANGGAGADITIGTLTLSGLNIVNQTINIVPGGLTINTGTAGVSLNNVGIGLERLALGDETLAGNGFVGDVYISGLNMSNNTITVSGK
ncbi:MAG: hypothetical protein Q8J78_00795, partial [Moraxellaceae bacterium]|nr:hypothetical protein [Moraxellaceae bacterium]